MPKAQANEPGRALLSVDRLKVGDRVVYSHLWDQRGPFDTMVVTEIDTALPHPGVTLRRPYMTTDGTVFSGTKAKLSGWGLSYEELWFPMLDRATMFRSLV